MNAECEEVAQLVESMALEGNLLGRMAEVVQAAKESGKIREVAARIRTKEEKGAKCFPEFVKSYVNALPKAEYTSYKSCKMVDRENLEECACKVKQTGLHTKEIEEMCAMLQEMKKSSAEETRKIINSLTDMALSNGTPEVMLRTSRIAVESEILDVHNVSKICEYAHAFYSLGMEYECFRLLECISKLEKTKPSVDKMRGMIMAKYLLQSENYRGYLLALEKLQGLDMPISPNEKLLEYVKHQRISTDHDAIIGYKSTKRPLSMRNPAVFKVEIPHGLWSWYLSAVGGSEPLSEESVPKISFLRKHKMNYRISEGVLYVEKGNRAHTYIDYVNELDEPKEKKAVRHPKLVRALEEKEGLSAKQPEDRSKETKEGAERAKERKKTQALRALFEKRDYLLRLSVEKLQKGEKEPKEEISAVDEKTDAGDSEEDLTEEETEEYLRAVDTINRRFRAAKEANVEILKRVVESFEVVQELLPNVQKYTPPQAEAPFGLREKWIEAEEEEEEADKPAVQQEAKPLVWSRERDPLPEPPKEDMRKWSRKEAPMEVRPEQKRISWKEKPAALQEGEAPADPIHQLFYKMEQGDKKEKPLFKEQTGTLSWKKK